MNKIGKTNLVPAVFGRNDLTPKLEIEWRPPSGVKKSKNRVRKAKPKHVKRVEDSIKGLGFVQPILIKGDECVDGHVRLQAA